MLESDEEAARTRFVVRFEGKEVSRYASRLEACRAQVHAEIVRLEVGPLVTLAKGAGGEGGLVGESESVGGGMDAREWVWQERLAAAEALGKLEAARGDVAVHIYTYIYVYIHM